jgi:signal transduction histidine kinase
LFTSAEWVALEARTGKLPWRSWRRLFFRWFPLPSAASDGPSKDSATRSADTSRGSAFTSDGVSGASRRLRALAALSGSLTDALGSEEAADLVEQKALSALEATSAVVVTLGPFPPVVRHPVGPLSVLLKADVLHVVHAIGLPAEVKAALDELPLDAPVPFAEVARTGEPLFLPAERDMRRYPDWAISMLAAGARAAAVVPVWANGELRGVLGLTWPAPRVFDEDERAFILTLGVMCAQAIMRAHLRAAERASRQVADTALLAADTARNTAEQANQSKAHFVATISHELRTPMNAVLGYTALLADEIYGPVSALQQEHIGRVRTSGYHLLGLIEDLLSYARVEAGHEVVHAEHVAVVDIIEASLVLVRPLAEKKGLSVRIERPAEPIEMNTDPRKLRQILINLLANAVKFTDAGEIVLVLRVEGQVAAARVCFEVTDPGRGMTPEVQAHIFDPFWQADTTSMKTSGSSGLGLSVARQLARLLGGDVSVVRSAPGEGSTFLLSLPANYAGPTGVEHPVLQANLEKA